MSWSQWGCPWSKLRWQQARPRYERIPSRHGALPFHSAMRLNARARVPGAEIDRYLSGAEIRRSRLIVDSVKLVASR
eukprot:scaffold65438_cov72-Phaeocystis_antarctica.AAC.4